METKDLVTVVVPVYNVEKYLDRCVNSILSQTYENIEIILVDDGSEDKCPEICENWAKKDNRIKVVHKSNAGLGMARNTGIDNATGEYICFCDSDDYIEPDTVSKAYEVMKKEKSDIVVYGFKSVTNNGKLISEYKPKTDKISYVGDEVQDVFLPDLIAPNPRTGVVTNLHMSACMALFSLRVIVDNNWRFASEREIIAEDVYSLLGLYKFVKKVCVLSESFYCYCQNEDSLTHEFRHDRYEKIKVFYIESLSLAEKNEYSGEVKKRLINPYLSFTIAAMKQLVGSNLSFNEKINYLQEIVKDDSLQNVVGEAQKGKTKKSRKVLFFTIRHKLVLISYLLLKTKN